MIWELRHEHKIGLLIEIADIPRSTLTITVSNLIIQSRIDMLKSKLKYAAFTMKAKVVMDIGESPKN